MSRPWLDKASKQENKIFLFLTKSNTHVFDFGGIS